MVLQCRGHEITEGMHPQYDLFKQWATVKRPVLEAMLEDRFILFGEWLYARHSVHYRRLPHYFFEFDIYDKDAGASSTWRRGCECSKGPASTRCRSSIAAPWTEDGLARPDRPVRLRQRLRQPDHRPDRRR